MKIILLLVLLIPTLIFGQNTKKKPSKNPIYFIDGKQVDDEELNAYQPNEIALIEVLKDKSATSAYGEKGKYGVILITSKAAAKKMYTQLFCLASKQYEAIYKEEGNDDSFQYVLNGKPLKEDYEADLVEVNRTNFVRIEIVDKDQLNDMFGIIGKKHGALIWAKTPKDKAKK